MIFENSKDNPITLFYGVWEDLFTIGFGTNAAQWKKTQSHTSVDCVTTYCSSRKRNYFTILMILKYLNITFELQLCSLASIKDSSIEAKREKNSLMINSWNVKSPISYRKHTEQTHKFLLPLLRSWCNRSIRATIGQKKRPTTADQFKIFHEHCRRNEFAISL